MPAWGARSRRGVQGVVLALGVLGFEDTLGKPKKKQTCPSGDVNCDQFATQDEAQRFFERCGGPSVDRFGLDTDHDGIACEHLP